MAIAKAKIASYAPWGNAQLTFTVSTGFTSIDATTGNTVQATETLEYLAALTMQPPSWSGKPGADETTYACRGRLLSPVVLDPRITNGSQAQATVNGIHGRFELVFDLSMPFRHYSEVRQSIQGTFRVIGGP